MWLAMWLLQKLNCLAIEYLGCLLYTKALLPAMWLSQKLGRLLCDLSKSFAAGYVTSTKAWLPALWTAKKLCCLLCYAFKSLAACDVELWREVWVTWTPAVPLSSAGRTSLSAFRGKTITLSILFFSNFLVYFILVLTGLKCRRSNFEVKHHIFNFASQVYFGR